ncbi:cuticular protein-like [Tropilaelaps mercedesae]|uniref:Cuticular protein-like n=1 Tax=Tropilaelaps mercedesae TaxID=418985 RepID=A0A1V9X626_9ACAR|nr:cuticular protein-like [Tropilaelaps mercedesae]
MPHAVFRIRALASEGVLHTLSLHNWTAGWNVSAALLLWLPTWPQVMVEAKALEDAAVDENLPRTMPPGSFNSSFTCGDRFGYFADVDLNCRIFHVCNPGHGPSGEFMIRQYSFACANHTIFDQLTLTCSFPEDSIPCKLAADFVYVNDQIGQSDAVFLTSDDMNIKRNIIEHVTRNPSSVLSLDTPVVGARHTPTTGVPPTTEDTEQLPVSEVPADPPTTTEPRPGTGYVVTSGSPEHLPTKKVNKGGNVIEPPRNRQVNIIPNLDPVTQPIPVQVDTEPHHGHDSHVDQDATGGFHVDGPYSHFAFGKETQKKHNTEDETLDKAFDRFKFVFKSKLKHRSLSKTQKKELKGCFISILDDLFDGDMRSNDDTVRNLDGNDVLKRIQTKMNDFFDLVFRDGQQNATFAVDSRDYFHSSGKDDSDKDTQVYAAKAARSTPPSVTDAKVDNRTTMRKEIFTPLLSHKERSGSSQGSLVHSPRVVHLRTSGRVKASRFKVPKLKEKPDVYFEQLPHHDRIDIPIAPEDFLFNVAKLPGRNRLEISQRQVKPPGQLGAQSDSNSPPGMLRPSVKFHRVPSADAPEDAATSLSMPKTQSNTSIFRLYYLKTRRNPTQLNISYNITHPNPIDTAKGQAAQNVTLSAALKATNSGKAHEIDAERNANNRSTSSLLQLNMDVTTHSYSENLIEPPAFEILQTRPTNKSEDRSSLRQPMQAPEQTSLNVHDQGQGSRTPFAYGHDYHAEQKKGFNASSANSSSAFGTTREIPLVKLMEPEDHLPKLPAVRHLSQEYDSYGSNTLLPQVEEAIMELQRSMLDNLSIPRDFHGAPFGTALWRRMGDRIEMVHMLSGNGKTVVIRVARKIKT